MISVNNISVSFTGKDLFKGISFVINKKDRIGLTGKNGAGKSTLLKIMTGQQEPDSGNISIPPNIEVGYLPQQMIYPEGKTVLQEALTAFEKTNSAKAEIKRITKELETRTDYESAAYTKLIEEMTHLGELLDMAGEASAEADAEKILKGLGFTQNDFTRLTQEFSGGWRMRIEIAKILLRRPNVLLLDEPTNHLDIESIQWLEDFLIASSSAIVMISHDRAFLDGITRRTIEISAGKAYDYKASYTKYKELRVERRQQQRAAYLNQRKMIEDTEAFIARFRYQASKAAIVQSRIKQLAKVERIEIDEDDFSNLSFRFPPAPRSGTIVAETKSLTKRYDAEPILEDIYLVIERGEKVAFAGKNGQGKTTLVRVLMNDLPYHGKMIIGHNVKIGYYAQNQDRFLDPNKTVFETLDDIAVGDVRKRVRDILGQFLFRGEDIDKKVMVLSGGERARLALAKLMLEPYNLLILDEPTNHLDMHSKDILKQALQNYDGTLILVSHDRDFLQGLVGKIYEFDNRKIKQHSGDIELFLKKKKLENLKMIEKKDKSLNISNKQKVKKSNTLIQKESISKNELRKLQNKFKKTEAQIEGLEQKIANAEKTLSSGEIIDDNNFYSDFEQLKSDLETAMENWELQSEALEKYI